jgi:putative hydrolase of the HAD superfamily
MILSFSLRGREYNAPFCRDAISGLARSPTVTDINPRFRPMISAMIERFQDFFWVSRSLMNGLPATALLIDADDTLWENNIYFEQVREQFLQWMGELGFRAVDVQRVFTEIEHKNIQKNGYGGENFIASLKDTYLLFRPEVAEREHGLQQIDVMAETVRQHPIQLLEGVRASLELLSQRHQAILFTKGSPAEQNRKVEASGLATCFQAVEIVREKSVAAFQEVILRHRLSKLHTWMIGNSPRSDINPAVAAGIRAFYVPHAWTWEREREDVCMSDRVTVLDRFSDLLEHL